YFFGRSDLNFIKRFAATGNKEAALRQIRQRIAEVQTRDNDAYIIEPSSYPKSHLTWLRGQTGITPRDLDEFKGSRAFECEGTLFWRVPHSFEPRDIQEQLAVSLKSSSAATLATLDPAGVLSVGYAQLTGSPVERINGFTSIRLES